LGVLKISIENYGIRNEIVIYAIHLYLLMIYIGIVILD